MRLLPLHRINPPHGTLGLCREGTPGQKGDAYECRTLHPRRMDLHRPRNLDPVTGITMTEITVTLPTPTVLCGHCGHRHSIPGVAICYRLEEIEKERSLSCD